MRTFGIWKGMRIYLWKFRVYCGISKLTSQPFALADFLVIKTKYFCQIRRASFQFGSHNVYIYICIFFVAKLSQAQASASAEIIHGKYLVFSTTRSSILTYSGQKWPKILPNRNDSSYNKPFVDIL